MTDQEIIGVMDHFYIGEEDSSVAKAHSEAISDIPEILKQISGTHEVSFKNRSDEKVYSIRSFQDSDGNFQYLTGTLNAADADCFLNDLKSGKVKEISQKEYIQKYRELEEE